MPTASTTAIRCIYCLRDRPSSDEHILLAGLDGKQTIPWVCGQTDEDEGCNHRLGRELDEPFLRETPFVIPRLFGPGRASDKVLFLERRDCGGYLDTTGTTLATQVFRTDRWTIVGSTLHPSVARMLENLPSKIRRTVRQCKEFEPTRLVIKRRRLLLRATSHELADVFEQRLRDESAALVQLLKQPQSPLVHEPEAPYKLHMWCHPNVPSRCAAKMAFNMLAHHAGPDVALRPEFNAIRDFITGRDVEPVLPVTSPDGEEGWTTDVRYVSNWVKDGERAPWLAASAHAIVLDLHCNALRGRIYIFGERAFTVTLGRPRDDVGLGELPAMLLAREGEEAFLTGLLAEVP